MLNYSYYNLVTGRAATDMINAKRIVGLMAERGMEPVKRETYSNGVRKITFRDPDGNEIGFGGGQM